MHQKQVDVTAVIPAYNRLEELRRLLLSMCRLSHVPSEVIVVDDCSTIPIKVDDLQCPVPVKVVRLNRHSGTVVAKNLGTVHAKGDYIWFLDSDAEIYTSHCLFNMLVCLALSPMTGAVGGEAIRTTEGRVLNIKYLYSNMDTRADFRPIQEVRTLKPTIIGTNNMLTPKKLLMEVGGFCEQLTIGEDKEYCFQLSQRGYRLLEDASFAIDHLISSNGRDKSAFLWELRNKFFQMTCSLTMLPFYKWFSLPLLDVFSKARYLKELARRKGIKVSAESVDATRIHKGSRLAKLTYFIAAWALTYALSPLCLLRAARVKLFRIDYLKRALSYKIA